MEPLDPVSMPHTVSRCEPLDEDVDESDGGLAEEGVPGFEANERA